MSLSALLLALLAQAASSEASASSDDGRQVRGMTISCQTWGREWGTDGFCVELDELKALGVNWVAIHPYASIRSDGGLRWRGFDPAHPPEYLARPIREAHARGMKILVKPHIAYWGSRFSWRGDIDFTEPEHLERFFAHYRRWIVEVARATRGADAFCIETELDRLNRCEAEWRAVIAAVREATDTHLTAASNWSDYQNIEFWDALDCIGVQAYFPLSESADPGALELARGWDRHLGALRALSRATGKPVVFTELGYDLSPDAAKKPWDPRRASPGERKLGLELQGRCLEVALSVLEREQEWLRGAFLWKWFVGDARRSDFKKDSPHMRAVMKKSWGER